MLIPVLIVFFLYGAEIVLGKPPRRSEKFIQYRESKRFDALCNKEAPFLEADYEIEIINSRCTPPNTATSTHFTAGQFTCSGAGKNWTLVPTTGEDAAWTTVESFGSTPQAYCPFTAGALSEPGNVENLPSLLARYHVAFRGVLLLSSLTAYTVIGSLL